MLFAYKSSLTCIIHSSEPLNGEIIKLLSIRTGPQISTFRAASEMHDVDDGDNDDDDYDDDDDEDEEDDDDYGDNDDGDNGDDDDDEIDNYT